MRFRRGRVFESREKANARRAQRLSLNYQFTSTARAVTFLRCASLSTIIFASCCESNECRSASARTARAPVHRNGDTAAAAQANTRVTKPLISIYAANDRRVTAEWTSLTAATSFPTDPSSPPRLSPSLLPPSPLAQPVSPSSPSSSPSMA